jgi:hypothetical protein
LTSYSSCHTVQGEDPELKENEMSYAPRHACRSRLTSLVPVFVKKFLSRFTPVIAGVAAAVAVTFSGIVPAGASTFVVHVQAQNRILTSQHLFVGEVLHLGLDGFPVRVTVNQWSGYGDVAWVSPFLPKSTVGKTVVVTG